MPKSKLLLGLVLIAACLNSCTTTGLNRGTPAERRDGIQSMRQEVLTELYGLNPTPKHSSIRLLVMRFLRRLISTSSLPVSEAGLVLFGTISPTEIPICAWEKLVLVWVLG